MTNSNRLLWEKTSGTPEVYPSVPAAISARKDSKQQREIERLARKANEAR